MVKSKFSHEIQFFASTDEKNMKLTYFVKCKKSGAKIFLKPALKKNIETSGTVEKTAG
jgi:hypothetical protein